MRSKGAAKRPGLHSQREINLSYFVTPKDNVEKKNPTIIIFTNFMYLQSKM